MHKELLHNFVIKFRVNSNLRAGFLPPNINNMEFPYRIYSAAFKEAREEIIKEKSCTEEQLKAIDNLYEIFMKHLKESENYSFAEEMMIKSLEKSEALE